MSGAPLRGLVPHAPSEARAVRRAIRSGEADPVGLLGRARALQDPAHAAPVLALLAGDPRLDAGDRDAAAREAAKRAAAVDRVGQKAEVWSEVLKALGAASVVATAEAAVDDVEAMPDGEWSHAAIAALAGQVGADGRRRLLARALRNPGFEAEGAKAVLDAAEVDREPGLVEAAQAIPDPDVRRRVLGHLHHSGVVAPHDAVAAAWAVPDRDGRIEALRALAYQCQDAEALDGAAASVAGRDPETAARFLASLAARADRLGETGRTRRWLAQALESAATLDGKPRRKLARKIATAMERAGMDVQGALDLAGTGAPRRPGGERPKAPPDGKETAALPAPSGHTIALVDAYEGGLGLAHLRAASRAAALCAAFGHGLVLVGFPTDDLALFVEAAASETSIGEDARPLRLLMEDGRLALVGDRLAIGGTGTVVATTPQPTSGKAVRMDDLRGPLTLAIGLGRRGLPSDVLERAEHHYELTGRGVSLETATAMGILADRLANVPVRGATAHVGPRAPP